MTKLIYAAGLILALVACQGGKKEKSDGDGSASGKGSNSKDLESRYHAAMMAEPEEGAEEESEEEDKDQDKDHKKRRPGMGIAKMVMDLFDNDGDESLSLDELRLMIRFTRKLLMQALSGEGGIAIDIGMGDKPHGDKPHGDKPHGKRHFPKEVFECLDADKDGQLSWEEMKEGGTPEKAKECFAQPLKPEDVNEDGPKEDPVLDEPAKEE